MLPTDMDLDYISEEPFFDLRNLYTLFQESKAGKVIVCMDSCFTYHLIEALASGVNSVDALFSETSQNVSKTSREIGGALSFQDPTMQGNGGIEW